MSVSKKLIDSKKRQRVEPEILVKTISTMPPDWLLRVFEILCDQKTAVDFDFAKLREETIQKLQDLIAKFESSNVQVRNL